MRARAICTVILLHLYYAVVIASAQGGVPFTFHNVRIDGGAQYELNGSVKVGGYIMVVTNSSSPQQFYVSHPGTIELWSGTNTSTDSAIIDVLGVNLASPDLELSISYEVPITLPTGDYHIRAHVEGETAIGKSATFTIVTGDHSPPCEQPPTYHAISSISDPRYTSMRIYQPRGGKVFDLSPGNTSTIEVRWFYVDYRNDGNVGVTNATIELLNEGTLETVALGSFQLPFNGDSVHNRQQFSISNLPVTPGAWRVRGNYTNKVENNGRPESALSEVFYVHPANATCGPGGPVKAPSPSPQGGTKSSRRALSRISLCFMYFSLSLIY